MSDFISELVGGIIFMVLLILGIALVFSIPTKGDAPQGAPPGVQFEESSTGLDEEPGEEESAEE